MKERCGKWMPRAKTYCALSAGHSFCCHSESWTEKQRLAKRGRDRSAEYAKLKSNGRPARDRASEYARRKQRMADDPVYAARQRSYNSAAAVKWAKANPEKVRERRRQRDYRRYWTDDNYYLKQKLRKQRSNSQKRLQETSK